MNQGARGSVANCPLHTTWLSNTGLLPYRRFSEGFYVPWLSRA
jgi:hypothetical protein